MSEFKFAHRPLALATLAVIASSVWAEESTNALPSVIVTATQTDDPLQIVTDPKAPRQPLPAQDGADYLKTIPGFSITRKSGTDGDAVFRGMSGSRLNILADGENILGGCNFRMDAPTAYIYPEIYDSLTVIKGPQTVLYGPGNSAGTVLFERKIEFFDKPGLRGYASALGGSFDRNDIVADLQFGNAQGYGQLTGTNSHANDYKDGDGTAVHSQFHRYSVNGAAGWTPDRNTRVELSGSQSDGEAAYADRGMDGTKFLRDNIALKFEKEKISSRVEKIEAQVYDGKVDHIMDDQELRTPGMMGYANLKRDTQGGRFATVLNVATADKFTVGVDTQQNQHRSRSAPISGTYSDLVDDASITQIGLFAELAHQYNSQQKLVGGYRFDKWKAKDERDAISMMGMPMMNPTAGETRNDSLSSGFIRFENRLASAPTTVYAGLGHTARFPDYWEMIAKESENSSSAFAIKPEKTNQLDAGLVYKTNQLDVAASLFYSKVTDFILADYSSMMKMTGVSRNIDATTYGGELSAGYAINSTLKFDSSLATVWGSNDTDHTALAQLPPVEARLGLSYDNHRWSVGSLLRLVASQERYDLDKGNIVGKDLGPNTGFAVFSLNAGWRPSTNILLSAGVDNLFNRTYAEFISRASGNGMGGAIPGYEQTTRVNEPGRTLWLKVNSNF